MRDDRVRERQTDVRHHLGFGAVSARARIARTSQKFVARRLDRRRRQAP